MDYAQELRARLTYYVALICAIVVLLAWMR